MMLFILTALSSLVAIVPLVSAQSALYGQCGGINWTGPTTCVAGSTCTYSNAYYSQCLPSSNAPSSVPSNSPTSAPLSSSHSSVSSVSGSSTAGASGPSSSPAVGNPYTGYSVFLSPVYTAEVQAGAANVADATTQSKALSVANIPTFIWFDQVAKVPSLDTYLTAAENLANTTGQKQLVQIVIYDLPNRDCAAKASNGEFTIANNGVANYENYIDQIVAIIKEHPTIRIVAIIEPDSLANLVTNLDVQACATAETAYKTCVTYAIQQLSTVGVYSYLDAGHAGWLGWPANLSPAAQLFGQLYTSAGSPAGVRGLATNVANYNSLTTTSPDPITQGNPNYDEMLYITALAPMLSSQGFPAHFIVEQARSGVQDIRNQWGDWCNIKGAGFGIRPNSNNTGSSLIDSIVWVKPGGESDGTSNTTSPRYDPTCSLSDATVPAPEAGTWFQAAFQTLVTAANPPL